jgi:hypothetical protein
MCSSPVAGWPSATRSVGARGLEPLTLPRQGVNIGDAERWHPDDSSHWNDNPRPFTWHKSAEEILDRLAGYCRSLNK